MKNIKRVLFVIIYIGFLRQANAQLPKWILGSSEQNAAGTFNTLAPNHLQFYEVDFTGTLTCTQRTEGVSIQNINCLGTEDVINCAIDATTSGISFYVFSAAIVPFQSGGPGTPDTIYFAAYSSATGADEVFGKVPSEGWGASVIESELVKRPGSATDYYFIYKTKATSIGNDHIRYVTINSVTHSVSAPIDIVILERTGEGMAVSQLDCASNSRWLFVTRPESSGDITLRHCAITNSGISIATDIYTISIPGNGAIGVITGVEIAPTNNYLAVCNYSNASVTKDLLLFDYNNATGTVSSERSYTNTFNYPFVALEFSPNASRIYIMQGGSSTFPNCIYNCPVGPTNYNITGADLLPGLTMSTSLTLESGFDGKIYVNPGHNSNFMYSINNPNLATATVSSTSTIFFGVGQRIGSGFPDQIDGPDANSALNPSISATATSICAGQSATLTGSGGVSYQWSGGATDTTAIINVTPIVTTNYYLQVSNGSCVGYDTLTIVVNSLPVGIISGSTNICSGQSTTLTASGASSYQWSGGSTATTSSITVSPLISTNYTVTPINGGCSGTPVSVTVNVTSSPVASITFSDDSICAGTIVTLTASGGTTYQWSGGSAATTATINVSPVVTTSYFLQAANGSCIDNDTFTVYSYPVPVGIISGSTNICSGQSTTLTASGASSYQWSGGSTATTSSITVSPLITTSYTVTPINVGCAGTPVSVTVNVTSSPVASIAFSDDSICAGTVVTLTASGGSTYQWSGGSTATTATINVSPVLNTFYYLQATNGTCVDNDTLLVVVVPYPIALISGNITGCGPLSVTFNNESSNASTYFWDFGDGSTSTLENPIHIYSDSGAYSVSLITTNIAGCSDTININSYITVFPSPSAGIEVISGNSIDNNSIILHDLSIDGTNCITYFGDGDSLIGCNWSQITHNYPDNGVYTITQIISNGICIDTVTITVLVESMSTIYVPNAFSPNGNGLNDIFNVYVSGVDKFKLMIFDRWGELIFETTDQYKGWDGIYKGKPVEQDVYVWKFDYTTKKTGDRERIGHVTVVR